MEVFYKKIKKMHKKGALMRYKSKNEAKNGTIGFY